MAAPSNPLFASQWYLDSGGNVDLNILPVWDPGSGAAYTGAGVSVLIFDDAVEIDPINGYVHSDLDGNYARDDVTGGFLHLTIGGVTYAPEPIRDGTGVPDTHGTQVAGVLAAENNDEGGVGVAYDITFTVAPILHSDAQPDRVGALQRSEDFDITNHSWGYQTDFEDNFDAAGWSGFAAALETSTTVGRGGLGTINVTSAGNDRQDGSDTNFHSFENSRFTITVAAADETGSIARYSRPGANILVSGLSDDGAGNGQIVTTDLLGSDGENSQTGSDGDYSHTFGGTSAAAPQVSGIVALMLEANPNLGWRDVQDILAYTARHTGGAIGGPPDRDELYSWAFNGATDWNLGGLHYSNDYGFGLVDARAAVRLAESWALQSTTANAVDGGTFSSGDLLQVLAVPDGGQASYEFSYGGSVRTETAEITLTIEPFGGVDHQPGDLSLVLVSPSGTESNIFNRPGYHANCDPDGAETFVGGFETLAFTFRSEAFRGENSQGTWTLRAEDHNANGLQAVITDIAFTAHGGLPRSDLVYVFTDAFGTMAGLPDEGGRTTLTDGPGIDTINAAAVSGAVDIDLAAGETSILAGGSFAIGAATLIENAIGGDGGDTIAGNFLANSLSGMRGDDTLDGGDGDDVLTGGPGTDSLDGGPGVDHVLYEDSIDSVVVDLQAGTGSGGDADGDVLEGIENVTGSPHNDNLTGSNAENTLIGGGGNDYLVANSQGAGSFTLLADFEDGSFGTFESVGFANIVTTSNPDVGGLWAAFVDAGQFAAPSDTEIEAFLGLAPGKLDAIGGIADRGSAMRATRDVTAGDELSFDWLFTSGEAGGFFQDFAFFSYSYAGSGTSDAFELIDASYLPPHGNTSVWTNDGTGWLTSVFTAPETGTMTIGVGAINFSDPGFPSDLVVDNFVLNRDLSAFSSQGGLPQFSELETGEVDDGLFSNNVLIGGDGDDTLLGGAAPIASSATRAPTPSSGVTNPTGCAAVPVPTRYTVAAVSTNWLADPVPIPSTGARV